MARQPSKILTAAELKEAKSSLKTEISGHSVASKTAEKAIAAAQKALVAAHKLADATYIKAGKDHVSAMKAASKAFEAVQKEQQKVIDAAAKASGKATAKLDSLAPAAPAANVSPAGASVTA